VQQNILAHLLASFSTAINQNTARYKANNNLMILHHYVRLVVYNLTMVTKQKPKVNKRALNVNFKGQIVNHYSVQEIVPGVKDSKIQSLIISFALPRILGYSKSNQ